MRIARRVLSRQHSAFAGAAMHSRLHLLGFCDFSDILVLDFHAQPGELGDESSPIELGHPSMDGSWDLLDVPEGHDGRAR
jgi:hypothetical protein